VAHSSIWVNGQEQSSLELPDRGLEFGDGLFETLLSRQGKPQFLQEHIARLQRGFLVLGFSVSPELICDRIKEACEYHKDSLWAAIRITVTRGQGERGYAPPANPQPNIIVRVSQLERDCAVLSTAEAVVVEGIRVAPQVALAGVKHLNRLEQVLAAKEAGEAGCDEGVMTNEASELVSVVSGNLFVVKNGIISTSLARTCPVLGTRRSLVIHEWAPRIGAVVEERTLLMCDLEEADEVFYSNALFGVRAISRVGKLSWVDWPITTRLFDAYLEDIQ
jgi:4-amino-4-deoxychorismate lyase